MQKVEITIMYSYSYTTIHTYDKANQLASSTTDGEVTEYAYDAALAISIQEKYTELGNNCFNVIATGIVSQDGYIQVGLSPNENFTNILHALYTYPSTIAPQFRKPQLSNISTQKE